MEPLGLIVRGFAVVAVVASSTSPAAAQTSCGKANSIAVSIAGKLDKDQFPAIVLSAKNIGDPPLTDESIDGYLFPRIHIEGVHGAPQKTQWYHRLILDYGYPGLRGDRMVAEEQHAPGETISITYPLEYYYFLNEPGPYAVYMDVHDPAETCDPNAKWLRTNTVQIVITPDQVKAWEARAGAPRVGATIKMRQPSLSLSEAPTIQIELKNDRYTDYEGDDFSPHVTRGSAEAAKTAYYRERLHESGARQYGVWEGPMPEFPSTRRDNGVRAHQLSTWEIDLRNFYKFDTPGRYSVYIEFPDDSGKPLRSNTIEFEITPLK
jgi:hypothetical protein